ncbi:MAG: DUF167 family protein [Candidatus Bathyarchaeota archaeon]|nr:DUF167 family protein [Candidatus Bathyarchaeota archaeon]
MSLTQTKDGALLTVYVKPNSQKFQITAEPEQIVIHCTQEPVKGKVNKELLKNLSKIFQTQVELAQGATSKQKQLLLKNLTTDQAQQILSEQPKT